MADQVIPLPQLMVRIASTLIRYALYTPRDATTPPSPLRGTLYRTARGLLGRAKLAEAMLRVGRELNREDRFAEALPILSRAEQEFTRTQDREGLARCRWRKGVALRSRQIQESAELLEDAVACLAESSSPLDAARAKRDLAVAYNLLERFDEAAVPIQEARACFQAHHLPVEVARCDLVEGSRLRQLTRYQEAQQILNQALATFQAEREELERSKALYMLGLVCLQTGEYETAISQLREARPAFQAAQRPLRVAYCNLAEGRGLSWVGELESAEERIEEARQWFVAQEMSRDTADCLLNLGNVAFFRGAYDLAVERYQQAADFYRQANLEAYVGRCHHNLGIVDLQEGRLDGALGHLHQAIEILEDHEIFVWAADCHYEIAEIYAALRETEAARFHAQAARRNYQREGVALKAAHSEALEALIAAQEGKSSQALAALNHAIDIASESGSDYYVALLRRYLGDELLRQEKYPQALEEYERARAHFAKSGSVVNEQLCVLGMGLAHTCMEHLEEARHLLESVLTSPAGELPEMAWQAYAGLGDIALAHGDKAEALHHYESALDALHTLRLSIPDSRLAGGYVISISSPYERGIDLALNLERPARALEIIEDYKAQVLKRMVHSAPRYERQEPQIRQLLEREAQARVTIQTLREELLGTFEERLAGGAAGDPEPAGQVLAHLQKERLEHRRLLHRLHATTMGHLETIQPFQWSRFLAGAGGQFLAERQALVYYRSGEELVILHTDGGGALTYHVKELSTLEKAALKMCTSTAPERRALAYQGQLHGTRLSTSLDTRYRQILYQALIPEEVASALSPGTQILIVPHGDLHHLPFATLENDDGFLAEQAVVSRVPSLAVLEGLLGRPWPAQTQEGPETLLVGIETFGQEKPPLDSTAIEVRRVEQLYREESDVLWNGEATVQTLKGWSEEGRLRKYRRLHLASHAYLDPASDALSALALWDSDLTSEEIVQLRLGPSIVVLSACQSGVGSVQGGDEGLNLAFAFLVAGAQTVVASLWHVDDASTVDLMVRFHTALDERLSPAAALALAQREAIACGRSPFEWGAFTVVGLP